MPLFFFTDLELIDKIDTRIRNDDSGYSHTFEEGC